MKKLVVLALALMVGSFSFAQKNELKSAEKAIKSGNYADAKASVMAAEPMIANSDDKMKAQFYFLKGQALYANGNATNEEMVEAIESFNMALNVEAESGKDKYTEDINELKSQMMSSFLTKANAALESKDYMKSSAGFEQAYRMSPKDTVYLYYAASTAVTAQDYDTSLKYYLELKDLGYDGSGTEYVATVKETGEEEIFGNKNVRDISVKAGTHIKPIERNTPSKYSEIIKNIALIYNSQGKQDEAIDAFKQAREANPDDLSLIMAEANAQLKMGNKEEFRALMEMATEKDPNNAELQYNLGVIAGEAGDKEGAMKYYERAIELNPDYADAYNNMAVMIMSREEPLVEEMNNLGTSAADDKRYNELRDERKKIYADAIPLLERVFELKPENIDVARTLMNIYSIVEKPEKFKEMKAKVAEMESQE